MAIKRSRAFKPPQVKGVTRIDDPGRHGVGFYARVTFNGKTHSKYFADAAHGGTEKAFGKALKWRNEKEKELGKPRTDRVVQASGGRSRTGISGVYRSRNSYVVAWTPTPGVLRREFINVNDYGEKEALRRAVELRMKREKSIYGKSVTTPGPRRRKR